MELINFLPTEVPGCVSCEYYVKAGSSMRQHLKSNHPEQREWEMTMAQAMTNGDMTRYVRVDRPRTIVPLGENRDPNAFLEQLKFDRHLKKKYVVEFLVYLVERTPEVVYTTQFEQA
jgi:hypothetical protein